MAETSSNVKGGAMALESQAAAPAKKSPSKAAGPKKPKKPRAKPSHPRTSEMVVAAIKSLKERGGSSLQAIKKYIAGTYRVDSERLAPFIKRYLKLAVANKELVQTKGKGASGSFKLSAATLEGKARGAKPRAKRPKSPAKKKKPLAPGASKAKRSPVPKKKKKPVVKKAAAKPAAQQVEGPAVAKQSAPARKNTGGRPPMKVKTGRVAKPKAAKPAKAKQAKKKPAKRAAPKKAAAKKK